MPWHRRFLYYTAYLYCPLLAPSRAKISLSRNSSAACGVQISRAELSRHVYLDTHTRMWVYKLTSGLQCPNIVYLPIQVRLYLVAAWRDRGYILLGCWMLVTLPALKLGSLKERYTFESSQRLLQGGGPKIHDPSHQSKSSLMQGAYARLKYRTTLNPKYSKANSKSNLEHQSYTIVRIHDVQHK